MLAIDDTLSMKEGDVGVFALQSMVVLALSLSQVKFIY